MPVVTINNKEVIVPEGITLIQACEIADVEIPRFCYHERLAIAGNCRMCLVEVEGGPPKPVASCAMPVVDGMKVHTDSPMVKKAREGVMEFLLANHPLDCPICDQAGECDLQDQAMAYGRAESRFIELKRSVKDKDLGPLIETNMTRCIHCTRCVRFMDEIAGIEELGAVGRGEDMQITSYLEKSLTSELSGNIIDLCPVGALTSKPYAFKARSWELRKTESVDVMDAVGSNIRIDSRGMEVMRILPILNEEINEEWISDKTRFCYDGLKYQRLDKAYVRKNGKLTPVALEEAYQVIADNFKPLPGGQIGALVGDLSGVEEILALKILMQKLGSNNIDCRNPGSKINPKDRAAYVFNTTIAGIEEADSCLLIGVNPRVDAPIINARIRKRFLTGKLKIAALGVDGNLTYNYEKLGNSPKVLEDILAGRSEYCKILANSAKPMLIIGSDVLNREDGASVLNYVKKIAEKYRMVSQDWNGFNMLHKSASLVGALDVGFVSNDHQINTDTILKEAARQQIKALYLLGVDNIDLSGLEDCFVIYQGSHGEKGAGIADVILPAAAYTEKVATYVNTEGRPQRTKKVLSNLGSAKEDWRLIWELAAALSIDLGFSDLDGLRALMVETNRYLGDIELVGKNQWLDTSGVNEAGILGVDEIIAGGEGFYTSNVIVRSSRILNKCSNIINRKS